MDKWDILSLSSQLKTKQAQSHPKASPMLLDKVQYEATEKEMLAYTT